MRLRKTKKTATLCKEFLPNFLKDLSRLMVRKIAFTMLLRDKSV